MAMVVWVICFFVFLGILISSILSSPEEKTINRQSSKCLTGVLYYASGFHEPTLVLAVDRDGKPISCESHE